MRTESPFEGDLCEIFKEGGYELVWSFSKEISIAFWGRQSLDSSKAEEEFVIWYKEWLMFFDVKKCLFVMKIPLPIWKQVPL